MRVIHEVQREAKNSHTSPESEVSEEDKLVELVTSKRSQEDLGDKITEEILQNLVGELKLDLELLLLNDPRVQSIIKKEGK